MSGSGQVNRECSEEQLDNWSVIMTKWKDVNSRPKQVKTLIRKEVLYVIYQVFLAKLLVYLIKLVKLLELSSISLSCVEKKISFNLSLSYLGCS